MDILCQIYSCKGLCLYFPDPPLPGKIHHEMRSGDISRGNKYQHFYGRSDIRPYATKRKDDALQRPLLDTTHSQEQCRKVFIQAWKSFYSSIDVGFLQTEGFAFGLCPQ